MKKNNKYIQLALGTVILLVVGLIYAWSIFKAPLKQALPSLTDGNLSFTFTVSMIFFCLGGILGGYLSKKLNHRIRLIVSSAIIGVGFFLISKINPQNPGNITLKLYTFYGFMAGLGVGIIYNTVLGVVIKWFQDNAGFASGILLMGFGFGSLILGGLASTLSNKYGIFSTFSILAITVPIIIIICSIFLKEPDKIEVKNGVNSNNDTINFTPAQMLKSSFFWEFVIWTILLTSCGLMIIGNAAGITESFGAPAILGLLVSVLNGFGRVILGSTYDKVGDKKTLFITSFIMLAAGVFMFIGSKLNLFPLVFIGILACGLSYGGCPSLASAIIKNRYGAENYSLNLSIANLQVIISALVGPPLSVYLINNANGSFHTSFLAIIIISFVTILLTIKMYGKKKALN